MRLFNIIQILTVYCPKVVRFIKKHKRSICLEWQVKSQFGRESGMFRDNSFIRSSVETVFHKNIFAISQ